MSICTGKSRGTNSLWWNGTWDADYKKSCREMGGTISFESEQGVGTTFYIELPFQIDHNIKHEELKTKEIKKASIKGVNVLLAEDNELNMEIAEFVLESAGANVIKAFNGKEALEIFKEIETRRN